MFRKKRRGLGSRVLRMRVLVVWQTYLGELLQPRIAGGKGFPLGFFSLELHGAYLMIGGLPAGATFQIDQICHVVPFGSREEDSGAVLPQGIGQI